LAAYIIETRATVRAAAKKFNISKSTVHKDLTDRLEDISRSLHTQVKEILEFNKAERHIRGGMATRLKYKKGETGAARVPVSVLLNRDGDAD
jgi:putative DeoR family transcriptional regulator (stage III sporulation protein D)